MNNLLREKITREAFIKRMGYGVLALTGIGLMGKTVSANYYLTSQNGKTKSFNDIIDYCQTGSIIAYGSVSIPSGWLECDGSAVSRTTYANLFAVVGTSFGIGDGSTTFNLPDFTDKFPRGSATVGGTGGSTTHQHTVNHRHSYSGVTNGSDASCGNARGVDDGSDFLTWEAIGGCCDFNDHDHSYSGYTDYTNASSNSVSNIPPYQNIVYIIKT